MKMIHDVKRFAFFANRLSQHKNLLWVMMVAMIFSSCCLLTNEDEITVEQPLCPTASRYLLTVRGYYDLKTCEIHYQLENTECGWTEDGSNIATCPGLPSFQLVLEDRFVELYSVLPIEKSANSLRIWYDEYCPYPGDFDNGYTKEHHAVVLLSEEHMACLQERGGFLFWFRVWVE